jgi:hypothetical protein
VINWIKSGMASTGAYIVCGGVPYIGYGMILRATTMNVWCAIGDGGR